MTFVRKPGGRGAFRPRLKGAMAATREGVGYRAVATNVAPFGDSISGQNFGTGTYQAHGYLVATNAAMGWPMSIIANGGVSGNTTTQMLARLDQFLTDYPTIGTLFILGGTNDPGAGISSSTTIANLEAMYALCRQRGVRPIALTILPRSDQGTGGLLTFIQTVNAAILASSGPLLKADTFAAMADAGSSLLPYSNAMYDSAPAVHPSIAGATRMARDAIVSAIAPIITAISTVGASNDNDPREYASNPGVLGDNADTANGFRLGTGITGTGPNGWTTGRRGGSTTGVASKSATAVAQMVGTVSANWDGTGYRFGGDDVLATGRYDGTWVGSTARSYGFRTHPTVANGFSYKVITPGTTGSTQPTWPTTEGETVTDGTVVWLCQRRPTSGDTFYAEVDLEFTGLTSGKWAVPRLVLEAINTSAVGFGQAISNAVDLSSTTNFALADYAPSFLRLRTPLLTLGSDTLRYLRASIDYYGQASSSTTMRVLRATIQRASP